MTAAGFGFQPFLNARFSDDVGATGESNWVLCVSRFGVVIQVIDLSYRTSDVVLG